ncbi:MAG: hypothetical protein AAF412_09905, partial [Pseudomonadota bacterium]
LSKGDISDSTFRRKVYEAAASAVHRSLNAKGETPQHAVESQNRKLAIAIRKIEEELKAGTYAAEPAVPPVSPPPTTPKPDMRDELGLRDNAVRDPQSIPLVRNEDEQTKSRIYVEPKAEPDAVPSGAPIDEKAPKKPRARFAKLLSFAIIVSLIGVGALWAINTGIFQSAQDRDTSVPNPEVVLESESFNGRDPGTANAPQTLQTRTAGGDGWIVMFTPRNPTALNLIGGATATVESDPFGDYALLATPTDGDEIHIDIPRNVLTNGVGNTLQVSLRARSDEGLPTQISVTCDLSELGDCGRRRFDVGQAESEFLIQVDLTQAQSTPSSGILKIDTDMQNTGLAIKLLEARVRVAEPS